MKDNLKKYADACLTMNVYLCEFFKTNCTKFTLDILFLFSTFGSDVGKK